ncbi:MAG: DEAD/DEAH box helicase, partial [Deltaproteobacteria bacterium]|nr:DEAD/DEAH box helicase [Deltaproteobacteria bacterium]
MSELLSLEQAPAGLGAALRKAGFENFTAIQQAILDPELAGRDLRISSQTGSGKTVALGLLLAPTVAIAAATAPPRKARKSAAAAPVVLLIAPTRELAGQLGRELTWLYAPLRGRVLVVTGGTSVMQERSQLQNLPQVVIGTPGRLLDHLRAGAMTLDQLKTVALDEADEMLDMNFEEE